MDFNERRALGRTELKVGRLGVACSYGAPTEAFDEAFERGCNYFYWGSIRTRAMAKAIRAICQRGRRDELVIVIQSYSRSALLLEISCTRALKRLALDYADVLLLGWHNRRPPQRILDQALSLKAKGMIRFLAISGHNRKLFPELAREESSDIFHIRYNAAHRGAESEAFPFLHGEQRPGVVTYTATRWGQLLQQKKMPPGERAPSASDCYRFALSQPVVDVCMTGPRNLDQMREALRALDLGPLGADELERLSRIGDHLRGRRDR